MERIEYLNLVADESRLMEVVDGRLRAHVPREDVVHMEICRTIAAERPIAQIILGIALLGVLYVPIMSIINWSRYGGTLHDVTVLICILPILLGTWLLFTALRRRVVMRVHTRSGAQAPHRQACGPPGAACIHPQAEHRVQHTGRQHGRRARLAT